MKQAHQNLSGKVRGSHNREKARKHLARTHRKIDRQRTDHHWKLALELVGKFDWLFFEDLNLNGMKRLWGRKVSDLAFGELLEKIKWQAANVSKQSVSLTDGNRRLLSATFGQRVALELRDRQWTCQS